LEKKRNCNVRFDLVAEGFGLIGHRVETVNEFAAALDEALRVRRPVLIDAVVDPSEYGEQM
ncbi:MAG: hypothetical protein FJX52_16945, partial [Alphaproteobacteria bacterium]|nr:hypothetical protein [Alphaproteobacteria bacterium]